MFWKGESRRIKSTTHAKLTKSLTNELSIPRPSNDEILQHFDAFMQSNNFTPSRQSQLSKLTVDQKWQLLTQHYQEFLPPPKTVALELKDSSDLLIIRRLRNYLLSAEIEWVEDFIAADGHLSLFKIFRDEIELVRKTYKKNSELLAECCRCTRSLLNTEIGFRQVLSIENSLTYLIFSLPFINIKTQALLLSALTAVCLVSEQKHLELIQIYLSNDKKVPFLKRALKSKDSELVYSTLVFVNTLINQTEEIATRLQIRDCMVKNRVKKAILNLKTNRSLIDDATDTQILIFEESERIDARGQDRGDIDLITVEAEMKATAAGDIFFPTGRSDTRSLLNTSFTGSLFKEEKPVHRWKSGDNTMGRQKAHEMLKVRINQLETKVKLLEDERITLLAAIDAQKIEINNLQQDVQPKRDRVETSSNLPPPPPPPLSVGLLEAVADAMAAPNLGLPSIGVITPDTNGSLSGSSNDTAIKVIPPPFSGGGPPPPPPSFGGPPPPPGASTAKVKMSPSVKMKGFMWQSIPRNLVSSTLWASIDETKLYDTLDLKEFESLFKDIPIDTKKEKDVTKGPKIIHLLPDKRANHIQIVLKGLKMSIDVIKNAIQTLDPTVFEPEQLQALITTLPTSDEANMIKNYMVSGGDILQLGGAENYLFSLLELPMVTERLTAVASKAIFHEKIEEVVQELLLIEVASEALRKCTNLKKFLELALAYGNYMNGRTARGGAWGFSLSSLSKLTEIRSMNNITLLHYLLEVMYKRDPKGLDFIQEVQPIHDATKVNLTEIKGKIDQLSNRINDIGKTLNNAKIDKLFVEHFQPFHTGANFRLDKVRSQFTKTEAAYKGILVYFAEPANVPSYFFFETWSNFIQSVEESLVENKVREKKVQQQQQQQQQPQVEFQTTPKIPVGASPKQFTPTQGTLDAALAKMKSKEAGSAFSRKIALLSERKASMAHAVEPEWIRDIKRESIVDYGERIVSNKKSTTKLVGNHLDFPGLVLPEIPELPKTPELPEKVEDNDDDYDPQPDDFLLSPVTPPSGGDKKGKLTEKDEGLYAWNDNEVDGTKSKGLKNSPCENRLFYTHRVILTKTPSKYRSRNMETDPENDDQ